MADSPKPDRPVEVWIMGGIIVLALVGLMSGWPV